MKLNKNQRYLLACSFGPDSMALFHMLLKEGYDFVPALINYNLREESKDELASFLKYCESLGIQPYYLDYKDTFDGNVENCCREIRYSFFARIIFSDGFDALLVAHHQDDLIETYLLQKKRNNLVSYYGIKEETEIKDIKVIRPLLEYKKSDLLTYCKANSVPFAIDKTNLLNNYERNKIRHTIIDNLNECDRESYLEEIKSMNEKLDNFKSIIKESYIFSKDVLVSFYRESKQLYCYALNDLAHKYRKDISISLKLCLEIFKILTSKKSNVSFKISPDLFFEKSYGLVYFTDGKVSEFSYQIDKPSLIENKYFYLDFRVDSSNRNITPNDYPITIRNLNVDDMFTIGDYSCKANRIFIDWKVPLFLRKRWPVIVNKHGIIKYIPRYREGFKLPSNCNFYVKNTNLK